MDEVLPGVVYLTAEATIESFGLYAHQHHLFYGFLEMVHEQGEGQGMG